MSKGQRKIQEPESDNLNAVEVKEEVKPVQEVKREKPANQEERYFRVVFSAKSSPNDSDDVILSVNAEVRIIKREEEVILPERYLVCADNACYPQFTQLPGEPRKTVGKIRTFPYQKNGEATKAEYDKMLKDGTLKTIEEMKKNIQQGNN